MVSTPGRSDGGVFRRSPGGVYMRRTPVEYLEDISHSMKFRMVTPAAPVNWIRQYSNHYPLPAIGWYWPLVDYISTNARLWGLDKIINGGFSSLDTTWKLGFTATGGPFMLQDPLVAPVVSWNSTLEQVEITFDTGWMEMIDAPYRHGCFGNWNIGEFRIWNQDDEILARFKYTRGGGMNYTCDPSTTYFLRIEFLTFRVWQA